MNLVILMGRLTRDCEVRFLQSGSACVKFGLAISERYKDAKGEWCERPNFFDCVAWGKRGEAFAKFHRKGALASLQGRLRYDSWDDKQTGAKRSKVEVVVEQWHFTGERRDEVREPRSDSGSWGHDGAGGAPAASYGGAEPGFDVDDTPF